MTVSSVTPSPQMTPFSAQERNEDLFSLIIKIKVLEIAVKIGAAWRESLAEQKMLSDQAHEKKQVERTTMKRNGEQFKEKKIELNRLSNISAAQHLYFPV